MGEMKVKEVLYSGRLEANTMSLGLFNERLTRIEREVAGLKEIVANHLNECCKK